MEWIDLDSFAILLRLYSINIICLYLIQLHLEKLVIETIAVIYIEKIINGRSFEGLTTQISTLLSFFYLCLIKTINHTRPPFIYFFSKCFFCSYFFICYYFIISLLISSLLYLSYSQVISKQKILVVRGCWFCFSLISSECYYVPNHKYSQGYKFI